MTRENNQFPLGLAHGDTFCNRVAERNRLKQNILNSRHTLLTSPRRYGKSSLVEYTLNEMHIPYVKIDFFITTDESSIERELLEAINQLINQIAAIQEAAFKLIKNFIKKLKLKLIVGTDGINLEIMTVEKSDPARNIRSALLLLEKFLASKNQQAVLFMDEFQEIGEIAENKGIEGAIRHVAQAAKYFNIVFSGSNRHLLALMFENRNRPLYKPCDKMTIDRIHEDDYEKHIQKIAKKKWKKRLSEKSLQKIFSLSERHSYYLNVLCSRIFMDYTSSPPNEKQIEKLWQAYIEEEKTDVGKELSQLSTLQKKLVIRIAQGENSALTSKEILFKLNSSSAAVTKALGKLKQLDFIYQSSDKQYHLIDPLIQSTIYFETSS